MRPGRPTFALPVLVASLLLPTLASASTAPSPPSPAVPADASEDPGAGAYTGWLVLADAAALGLTFGGLAAESSPLALAGAAALFLGAPAVHVAHRQPGRAVGSLGLRLGVPVLGGMTAGLLTALLMPRDKPRAPGGPPSPAERERGMALLGATFLGAAGGYVIAVIADWAVLGRAVEATAAPTKAARVMPTVALTKEATSFGLAGRF